jgi:hypothetical protein
MQKPGSARSHARNRGRLGQAQAAIMIMVAAMKTRTHFKHSIDMFDAKGDILEHLAGVEDFVLTEATYDAAVKRWDADHVAARDARSS